jgi:hypothetical protein
MSEYTPSALSMLTAFFASQELETTARRTGLGCLNQLLSVDRFLDSRCQSRLCFAWWPSIFRAPVSSREPQLRPMEFFITR